MTFNIQWIFIKYRWNWTSKITFFFCLLLEFNERLLISEELYTNLL
jgi:hypothetical protein